MPTVEISEKDLNFLKNLAHELVTQNRHGTAEPIFFVVRTSRELVAPEGHGRREVLVDWSDDGDPPLLFDTTEEASRYFQSELGLTGEKLQMRLQELESCGMHLVHEDHNVFLTEVGFHQHMQLNGHNYRGDQLQNPRFYVQHAFRNPEFKTLLDIVKRLGGEG